MNKKVLIIIALAVVFLSSCKTARQAESAQKATSARHLVTLAEQAEPSFSNLNANSISFSLKLDGKTKSASGSMKIKTDSLILISIAPFMGIELFSIELYPDKWIIYNKVEQEYYTDDYKTLFYRFGIDVDFNALQSLFSARLFCLGEKEINIKKCNFIPRESGKNEIQYESEYVKQSTLLSAQHLVEQVTLESLINDYSLTAFYNDYVMSKGVNYPRNIIFRVVNDESESTDVNIKISKITFNSDLKISVSNPERYKRRSLNQLLR